MRKKGMRSVFRIMVAAVMCLSLLLPTAPIGAASGSMKQNETETSGMSQSLEQYDSIGGLSADILYDTSGKRVMACGGEVHQFTENGVTKWYWFGVDDLDKADGEQKEQGIHLYSSSDLYNWDYEGIIWDIADAAHPKVLYDRVQEQYVMWVSDGQGAVVGTSSSIKGPFTPVGDSGADDIMEFNLYEESPGKAYVIYPNDNSSSGSSYYIAQLSSDYMRIEGTPQALQFEDDSLVNIEGGIFKKDGKYYFVNAGQSQYAVAGSLTDTWKVSELQMWDGTSYKTIVDKNQTSNVFHAETEDTDKYVCVGDSVGGGTEEVRYIWLPIEFFDDGTIALRELSNWKLEDSEPETPVPDTPVPDTPVPETPVPETPVPETPVPETPVPDTPVPETPVPETPVPETPDATEEPENYDTIAGLSGEVLYDTEGERVYACGGEVHQVEEDGQTKWYWFGVNDLEIDGQKNHPGIHLYSSTDLYNWKHEGTMGAFGDNISIAHPKMLYNEQQQQYVMWVELDTGEIRVAASKSIKGPFTILEGAGASDISGSFNLYKDSDGEAYIIYGYRNSMMPEVSIPGMRLEGDGLFIARLSDDYTTVEGTPQSFQYTGTGTLFNAEGGIFERNGKYYMVNAGNPDDDGPQYAVADSLNGPWTVHKMQMWNNERQEFEEIVTKNQTSHVFHVKTKTTDTYVCVGDSVGGEDPEIVSYIWLPIKFFENGTIALEKLSNWKLDEGSTDVDLAVTEVKLLQTSKTMKVGEKYQIGAMVYPENATDKTLSYESSDASVASVSGTGQVEAKKEGNARITITSVNGKTAELLVTVEAQKPPVEVILVKLSETSKTMKVGEKYQIWSTIFPASATNKSLLYKSSDASVVSVSGTGLIEAKKAGNARITVISANGKTAELKVTVTKEINVQKVLVPLNKITVGVGEKVQLEAAVYPENALNNKLTYKPSNNKVKVSKNGKITAQKTGTCKITISSSNHKKTVVNVTIKKKPGKISLNAKKKTLKAGKKFQIKPKLPGGTASYKITYTSNKKSVAAVSNTGKVTAKKKGNAVITVKTYNGKKAILKIHVK